MSGHEHTTEHISSHRGVDLAVHHFGGSGPTLFISHATGFHGRCYVPMLAHLRPHFDVWSVDFAGHGSSAAPPDDNYDWYGYGNDLLDAIDHVGTSPVRVFGHSMGGAATLLAEKTRPGTIEAAWLYEPIIFPPEIVPRNSMMAEAAGKRRREFDSRATALQRYASRPPLGIMRADALAAYVEYGFHDTDAGTVTLACTPEAEAATFNNAGVSVNDIRGLSPRIVIACGHTEEGPNPAEFAGPTADALANAELVRYERLTHFGPMQDPTQIALDAANFLR